MNKKVKNFKTCDVVVIGAGLTGLTTAYTLVKNHCDVCVLERQNRVGGQIQTHREGDFTFESGPNTGVVSWPEVTELFDDLDCTLQTAREDAKRRLIWKGDCFHELPCSITYALRTPLFTLRDKIGILGEPFRRKGTNPDETVGEMTCRRLGRSFLDYAVDPFLSGVYAGDPMKLITRHALPKLYNLEQNYGSFIRGSIAKMKEPKTPRDLKATKKVFSTQGGMSRLVEALTKAIGEERIRCGASEVTCLPIDDNDWHISFRNPQGEICQIVCHKIITTVGAYELPEMLPVASPRLMNAISNLRYAPIVQVSVGIKDTGSLRFNAFGGLVPTCEHQPVLGILFPSACFDGRAPQAGALFSYFIGGIRHPEILEKSDDEICATVVETLHRMLKLPADVHPDMIHVFRHEHAIPQYEVNSQQRFDAVDCLQRRFPGLVIGGNLRGGIGMADRIRQAVSMGLSVC